MWLSVSWDALTTSRPVPDESKRRASLRGSIVRTIIAIALAVAVAGAGYWIGRTGNPVAPVAPVPTGSERTPDARVATGPRLAGRELAGPGSGDVSGAVPSAVGRQGGGIAGQEKDEGEVRGFRRPRTGQSSPALDADTVISRIQAQEVPLGQDARAWADALDLVGDSDLARVGAEVLLDRMRSGQGASSFDGPVWKMTIRHSSDSEAERLLLSALHANVNSLQRSLAMRAIDRDFGGEIRARLRDELEGPAWLQAFSGLVSAGDEASIAVAIEEWAKGGQRSVVLSRSLGPVLDEDRADQIWNRASRDSVMLGAFVVAMSLAQPDLVRQEAERVREATRLALPAVRPPSAEEQTFAYYQVLYALRPLAGQIAEAEILEFLVAESERTESRSLLAAVIPTMRNALERGE